MPAVARLTRLFARRAGAADEDPFDAGLFSRLDRMRLRFDHAHGARAGETPVRGLTQESGIEVESFKSYAAGDDIRYVDWNAVGRLDQLLTRRFVAEREIPIHILLDASASMGVPAADRKFAFAMRTRRRARLCRAQQQRPGTDRGVALGGRRGGGGGIGVAASSRSLSAAQGILRRFEAFGGERLLPKASLDTSRGTTNAASRSCFRTFSCRRRSTSAPSRG